MADLKNQINFNYHCPYYSYAFGIMYQSGPEQNHGNLSGWSDSTVADLGNSNPGVTQAYYAAESPPHSPERHAVNGHGHYQGSGVVYLGDTQPGSLLVTGPPQSAYDARENEVGRAGSDTMSDTEVRTSPDSWSSSSSSREGSLPHADPATWAKKDLHQETSRVSPGANRTVSSSLIEEPRAFPVPEGNLANNNTSAAPITAPKKPGTPGMNNPRGKVRTAFSESQMNTLVHRFSVQRYLTPAEMKNLAELTGLTYKQVKTWFQNRRMKLRRHQKDTSWVSERYSINKESMFSTIPPYIPPYQGEARPQLREHYNQHVMEAAFKKTTPQNLAFYLAAMGTGSPGYPAWSSTSPQAAAPNRPQMTSWSMPQGVGNYEYNPSPFNLAPVAALNNFGHDPSFENNDGVPVNTQSSLNAAMAHNTGQ
uniref:Homeobox protein Nkx-2.6-like n=1 Tax=Stegastes partitus TaxID=144197 RepID=A0A3B4ZU30_9TELE